MFNSQTAWMDWQHQFLSSQSIKMSLYMCSQSCQRGKDISLTYAYNRVCATYIEHNLKECGCAKPVSDIIMWITVYFIKVVVKWLGVPHIIKLYNQWLNCNSFNGKCTYLIMVFCESKEEAFVSWLGKSGHSWLFPRCPLYTSSYPWLRWELSGPPT